MTDQRLDQLSGDVYNHVFHLLDAEPDITGNEAGRIATKLEKLFRELVMADPPDECMDCCREIPAGYGLCPDCEWARDGRNDDDGDPGEAQEWYDFDPDC